MALELELSSVLLLTIPLLILGLPLTTTLNLQGPASLHVSKACQQGPLWGCSPVALA